MSNSSLVRVNQKLAQAKFLIDLAAASGNEWSELQQTSFIDAVCFHLYCAYQFYLRELAETYQLKITQDIRDESALVSLFENKNKFPVEARELIQLRDDSQSWLSQLIRHYENIQRVASAVVKSAETTESDIDENLILAINLDQTPDESSASLEMIAHWQRSFRDLVIRQRQTSAEF